MSQSRRKSAIESVFNVAIGYAVAFIANITILPLFGYSPTISDNFQISIVYTAISLIRSYCVRRAFNKLWS